MTKIVWGATGARGFEAGVDRGVLFAPQAPAGVPWNGLVSVKESPSGGDPKPYYMDGIKFLQVSAGEEFNATIDALSAPSEFSVCDGTANIYAGLFITQQPRKTFAFTYRTLIGNDVDAENHGYKIHLVWGALAQPADREHASISSSAEPMDLSWDITTVPQVISGFKPSAHMVINSLLATPLHLSILEDIIYGTDFALARMPTQAEVVDIFSHSTLTVTDNGDGTFTAVGSSFDVSNPTVDTFQITHPAMTDNGDGTFTVTTGVDYG